MAESVSSLNFGEAVVKKRTVYNHSITHKSTGVNIYILKSVIGMHEILVGKDYLSSNKALGNRKI